MCICWQHKFTSAVIYSWPGMNVNVDIIQISVLYRVINGENNQTMWGCTIKCIFPTFKEK